MNNLGNSKEKQKKFANNKKKLLLHRQNLCYVMNYTENITIKNPSRKLEGYLRDIGVKKYLWLQKLRSDDVQPTKTIYV